MTYLPALPSGAYTGWLVWQRQGAVHQKIFNSLPRQERQESYFRANIAGALTAEQLVSDRNLLEVALGAFGLQDDLKNRYFIRKVLEGGTLTEGALALRLADPRYRELAEAFGYGNLSTPSVVRSDFADRILSAWRERALETSLGEVNEPLRFALNAKREIGKIAGRTASSDTTKWYSILGQPALREVFMKAYGLSSGFGALALERQVQILSEKSESFFGSSSPSQFSQPEQMEALIRRFLHRSDLASLTQASAITGTSSSALMLLRSTGSALRLRI